MMIQWNKQGKFVDYNWIFSKYTIFVTFEQMQEFRKECEAITDEVERKKIEELNERSTW